MVKCRDLFRSVVLNSKSSLKCGTLEPPPPPFWSIELGVLLPLPPPHTQPYPGAMDGLLPPQDY